MENGFVAVWLIIAVAFFAADIFTSAFLFVWFGFGALVSMVGAIFGLALEFQILLFLVASLAITAIGYPWAQKKFKLNMKRTKTRDEEQIGAVYKATSDIDSEGEIKLDGVLWKVINKDGKIYSGDSYRITGFKGNKIIIEKSEDDLK
ncbi:MAG: NfeD family protein [Clostridiaceae bacterium]